MHNNTLKELRERYHAGIPREAEAIIAKAKAEGREVSDDETARMERLAAEQGKLSLEILDAEAAERGIHVPPQGHIAIGEDLPGSSRQQWEQGGPRRGKRYAELFGLPALSSDGFRDSKEYWDVIESGRFDPRLKVAAAMGTMPPSSGGFMQPEEFAAQMLDKSLENEIVRPRCDVQPMKSDTKKIAGVDALDNSTGTPSGLRGVWLAEQAPATDQQTKFRMIELSAKKCAIFGRASNEIDEWISQQIEDSFIGSTGWTIDYAALRGSGAGQPLGALNDPALVVQAKEGSQTADTINYTNLTKMLSRIHPACFKNSVWVTNPTTIPQLLALTIVVGSGGSAVPVMTESNGEFRILTRPVLFTEKLPVLGDQGDIILADWSQYTIGLRKEVTVEKSVHVGWQTDTSGYRAIIRMDGQGRWNQPFKPLNGSTQSWIVALEAR
ncbi:MAG TPA: phage major capsid protein [Candidatus Polarisedimenticolaceae bacterium]|nr:phage major capsid protein [Candidatus Polarisedimenticolaceae bacterium]